MKYTFPIITDIEQVRETIKGREEFIEADKGDYIVFNYLVNFEDTFPPVTDEKSAILRECRGMIFEKRSGRLIARRYHKFFNMGEKAETRYENVDWTKPHVILEKLDGSMITTFELDAFNSDRRIAVGTKMGETDVAVNAKQFMDCHPQYWALVHDCADMNLTPIFEWCSRKNRIVVDYPEDRLVLTGIRLIELGAYLHYEGLVSFGKDYNVEVIKKLDLNILAARESLSSIEDEGYIVRFDDGHMLKLKGTWYLQMHKTLEHIQHEKDLIRLVVDEKLDDAKPFLPEDLVKKLDKFGKDFFHEINLYAEKLGWSVIEDYDKTHGAKKRFAELTQGKDETKIRFQGFDWLDNYTGPDSLEGIEFKLFIFDKLIDRIKNNLSTRTKVDTVRHLFGGLRWEP
jgi:T4 RnlA family RNA ligase